jgi:hypothetical protein
VEVAAGLCESDCAETGAQRPLPASSSGRPSARRRKSLRKIVLSIEIGLPYRMISWRAGKIMDDNTELPNSTSASAPGADPAQNLSRREFTPRAAAALTGIMLLPRHVLGGPGHTAPSDKLNLAGVGVGGMGAEYLKNLESENIVALCDLDSDKAAKTFNRYPAAKTYIDFREMLEKEKGIDAVVIGTPDHTHAAVAMAALQLRKHVYCAKPMTRTIHEARAVVKAAREAKVATQMSVQSCASEEACATAEWVRAGAVGEVREVHVWTDRPVWPQGLTRSDDAPPVPPTFAWDLWLGPAPARPYHPVYHPFRWRGWYDFGTGALGDMGCHTFHVIFQALRLEHPTRVQACSNFTMLPAYARSPGNCCFLT